METTIKGILKGARYQLQTDKVYLNIAVSWVKDIFQKLCFKNSLYGRQGYKPNVTHDSSGY